MNDAEWAAFTGLLEANFRGGLPEDRDGALRIYFGKVPEAWALRAVDDLVERGQVFVPVSSELVAALRRVAPNAWHHRRLLRGLSVAEQVGADAQAARAAAEILSRRLLAEGGGE